MAIFISKSQQPFPSTESPTTTHELSRNQPEGGTHGDSSCPVSSQLVLKPSASQDRKRILRRIRHYKALNRLKNAFHELVIGSNLEENQVAVVHFCFVKLERVRIKLVSPYFSKLVPSQYQLLFFQAPLSQWLEGNVKLQNDLIWDVKWNIVYATVAWWAWRWRNEDVYGESSYAGDRFEFSAGQAKEFAAAWSREKNASRGSSVRVETVVYWLPPPEGWYKVNTDGASKGIPGWAGGGGVIRDSRGFWVAGFVQNTGVCNSLTSEMWAIWRGLTFAWVKDLNKVIVVTNSTV